MVVSSSATPSIEVSSNLYFLLMTWLKNLFQSQQHLANISLEQLEESLLKANVKPSLVMEIVEAGKKNPEKALTDFIEKSFAKIPEAQFPSPSDKLQVIFFVGTNGSGKTSSLAKLGYHLQQHYSCVFGAADTFRAAAVDQLKAWAHELGIPAIGEGEGADPGSVVYNTIASALAKNAHYALIDTSGRLGNNKDLMAELRKIYRVAHKFAERIEVHSLFIFDISSGFNAFSQMQAFSEVGKLDAVILTKADAVEQAGIVLSWIDSPVLLPVWFYVDGESKESLHSFEAESFRTRYFDFL